MLFNITRSAFLVFHRLIRVAVYCRVSSMREEQLHSLATQREYYNELVQQHRNWMLVNIYSDTASGRSVTKRNAFQTMIEACRHNEVDLIITKSISRLGRNTLDVLMTLRKLTVLKVDVYFESEDYLLSESNEEFFLTLQAAIAQEESHTLSQNITWGIQRCFEDPNSLCWSIPCYGYQHNEHHELVPKYPEADHVRLIFKMRSSGCSVKQIADELESRAIPSPRGNRHWEQATIRKMLANEKYFGDVILQKTFVKDFLSGKQVKNNGQKSKYMMSSRHEAIIKKDESLSL